MSTCGFAVEWLRSSYSSKWSLFRNQPGTKTAGRYVRVEPDTAHLPFLHNLGSAVWRDRDEGVAQVLGEADGESRTWDDGAPFGPIPPASTVGNTSLFAAGDTLPLPMIDREIVNGWDSRCFANFVETPFPENCADLQISSPATLLELCDFAGQTYSAPPFCLNNVLAFLGPGATGAQVANSASLLPGSCVAHNGKLAVAFISGTTNFVQLALQAVQLSLGPDLFSSWGTIPLWRAAAYEIHSRLESAGVTADMPVLICGHSYGGAVACNLAAVYHHATPDRDVCLVTFGCPKPGDSRLIRTLRGVDQYHLQTDGDLVVGMPPLVEDLGPLSALVPFPVLILWSLFERLEGHHVIELDGSIFPGYAITGPYSALIDTMRWAFLGGPVPNILAHQIGIYFDSLNNAQ